jgi:putative aldouronate transport system substrate-binding protein
MNYAYPMVAISASSQNKEAAMRFVDLFYDPYYGMQTLFGSMGECIGDNGDGSYTVLPPADKTVDPGTWKWINALADFSPMYISDTLKLTLPADMQKINELDKVYADGLAQYGEDDLWPGPFMKYTSEQSTELSNLNLDISSILSNKMATWISVGGIDTEWDEYLATLDQAGLMDAIGIYQEVVNAFYGK